MHIGISSVGRFVFKESESLKTIYALENIIGPVGIPVYYQISKNEYEYTELFPLYRTHHIDLCGFVEGREEVDVEKIGYSKNRDKNLLDYAGKKTEFILKIYKKINDD